MTTNERIDGAYKRYPDLVLDQLDPVQIARYFEQSVLLNTSWEHASFVHKMILQGAHAIRSLVDEVAELTCPDSYADPPVFNGCGKCVVCKSKIQIGEKP